MAPPPEQRKEISEQLNSPGLSCFWLGAADGGGRLMLVGELDLVTADRAREAIRRVQDKTAALICDLGDVWFVDLSGLRVLLEAAARARRTGARLTIANCPPIVPRMLVLLQLVDALDIQAAPRPVAPPAPRARSGRLRNRPAPRGLD
jgi:anti-anti-sigma factor